MSIAFSKYETLGDDFIVVEDDLDAKTIKALCCRQHGVGADGVLNVRRDPLGARASLSIFLADSTRVEMCGNAIRCAAMYLKNKHLGTEPEPVTIVYRIETDCGTFTCRVHEDLVTVTLPPPADVQALSASRVLVHVGDRFIIIFDDDLPLLAAPSFHSLVPHPAETSPPVAAPSIGIAHQTSPTERPVPLPSPDRADKLFYTFDLIVSEPGTGWTPACSVCACACAIAAVYQKRAPPNVPIRIVQPGGTLLVVVGGRYTLLTGPARHVFDGVANKNLTHAH